MKLRDWYDFNFRNKQFGCNLGDVFVKVFRKESYKTEDMIFEQLMDHKDMIHLFGDYKMFLLKTHSLNGYCTICVLIYKADEKVECT